MVQRRAILVLLVALVGGPTWQLGLVESCCAVEWDYGSIGIYADTSATSVCAQISEGGRALLPVIATLGPNFPGNLAGAEFRIEVSHPEGWQISYLPPDGAVVIGNPLDFLPDERRDPSGATLAFTTCRPRDAAGRVGLGTLFVQNRGGQPTELRVKQRSTPTNKTSPCALFTECNDPYFSTSCMTPHNAGSCTQLVAEQSVRVGQGCDDPYFVAALNRDVDPRWTAPRRTRDVNREVLAFLSRRDHIELPEGEVEARLEAAHVRPTGLRDVLHAYGVEWVAKGMPCFDLADTIGVSRTGEVVRLTDWSLLWIFTIPSGVDMDRFIEALEALSEVGFAEPNGIAVATSWDSDVQVRAPNPLVVSSTVQLRLVAPMPARIDVYDVRGRWVRRLADSRLPAGSTDLPWDGLGTDGERLPSGVYFVHVSAGDHRSVHKLIFVR